MATIVLSGASPHPIPALSLPQLSAQYREYALRVCAKTEETVNEELLYLRRFFLHFDAPDSATELFALLDPGTLTGFLRTYMETHGPGSRRWMQLSLRSFLRFSYHANFLVRDFSALVPAVRTFRMGRIARALPDDCLVALETGIERQTSAGLRDSAIVSLLNTYGVRGVQIRRLRLDHLDWENNRIHFPAAKGGHLIEQHLTPHVGNRLVDYLTRGRPTSLHQELFLTLTEPFRPFPSASSLSQVIRFRLKQLGHHVPAGVSQGTHGFRHAFATRLVGKVPFKELVDQLGHRDPSSTLIYGKVDLEALLQAALPWPGGEL